jgi:hypothetical protein
MESIAPAVPPLTDAALARLAAAKAWGAEERLPFDIEAELIFLDRLREGG